MSQSHVQQVQPPPVATHAAAPPAGRDLLLLLLACAALWGWTYGGWDFWGPDEPRYVQIARELLSRSNWLVLTVMGEPYDQKPPLPYWMMAGMLKLSGGAVSSWVVRVPALLFGVMTVLLTYLVGRARLGRRAGWLGAWVLLTSVLFIEEVPTARLDILLTGWVMLAMWAWLGAPSPLRAPHSALETPPEGGTPNVNSAFRNPHSAFPLAPHRAAIFWLAVTGAFFIKGPVAWLIVLGTVAVEAWLDAQSSKLKVQGNSSLAPRPSPLILIFIGAALINLAALTEKIPWLGWIGWVVLVVAAARLVRGSGMWRGFRAVRPALGLPFTIGVVVAWQVALRLTAPHDSYEHQLQTATVDRLVNPTMHLRWPGYYLGVLFTDGFAVWSVVLTLALWGLWRARRSAEPTPPGLRPILAWFLWPLLLLTIVPTKREQYLLPAFPAMALLVGWWLDAHWERPTVPRWLRRAGAVLAAAAGAALMLTALFLATALGVEKDSNFWQDVLAPIRGAHLFGWRVAGLGLCGALLAASSRLWPRADRVGRAASLWIASVMLAGMVLLGCAAPLLNPLKSPRGVNQAIAAHLREPGEKVGALGSTYKAQYQVYSTHRMKDLESGTQWLRDHAATLPRIIIGEAAEKKWKKIEPVLEELGYKRVYRSSPELDYVTVMVRQ